MTRFKAILIALLLAGGIAGSLVAAVRADGTGSAATVQDIVVEARQFSFSPEVIRVARGQRVRITLRAMDVTHGLYADDYGVGITAVPGHPTQMEFVADKAGEFHLRCTQICGPLHPFMAGRLIVEPNVPFNLSLALTGLVALGMLGIIWVGSRGPLAQQIVERGHDTRFVAGGASLAQAVARTEDVAMGSSAGAIRYNFLNLPVIGSLLRWRGLQFALMLPFLLFLSLAVMAGISGTPVGSHNFGIVFVWIVWWPLLIILLIPLGGRAWCAACPLPAPGEWLQRLAFVTRRSGKELTFGRGWPKALRNMWLQNGAFLLIALFSTVVLTTPLATTAVLGSFAFLALVLSLIFAGRSFCRYVCPLGGFIGLCAMAAPLAVRVKDKSVCRSHKEKECIKGSAAGYGCPWFEYPGTMDRNAYCGLCMECVKTCPKGNIAVGLQGMGRDLVARNGRADEAFRTFIALGSAALYAAAMLGPWGWLKALAGNPLAPQFAIFAGLLLGTCLIVVPALFLFTSWLAKVAAADPGVDVLKLWKDLSYGLIPLALMTWIAFSVSLVLASGHYIVPVISDPLGHGWDLFGTAGAEGRPLLMNLVPYLQGIALLIGLAWSIRTCWRIAERSLGQRRSALRALLPVTVFLSGATATLLWVFQG